MKIEINKIELVQGIALVKLYKPRTRKEKQTVLDEEKNKGKDPKKDIMALKTVEEKVMYNTQTVEILNIEPSNPLGYKVGDIVVMDYRKVKEFDVHKDIKAINTYDIIGKLTV